MCYIFAFSKKMSRRHLVKCGISPLMFQLKVKLQIWRQGSGLPDWLDNVRLKEGKRDPPLTESWNQKKCNHLEKHLLKHSFELYHSFRVIQLSVVLYLRLSSRSCIIVDVAISSKIGLLKQTWFLLARKKQSNRRLLSQLDDFDQDIIIGNTANEKRENIRVNEGTGDANSTVATSGISLMTIEKTVNVKTLGRCFIEKIDRQMSNIVDTVEDRIRNAVLTAIDNIAPPKIELAIRSKNASSGRDATSITANSEHLEHIGIIALFQNTSEINNVLHISNVNDETRNNISNEVSELSVRETRLTGNRTRITWW